MHGHLVCGSKRGRFGWKSSQTQSSYKLYSRLINQNEKDIRWVVVVCFRAQVVEAAKGI